MIVVFALVPAALVIAAAVIWAQLLNGKGEHTRAAIRHAVREGAREGRAGFGHLGRAGCMPLDTELLADPWDLAAPASLGPAGDPYTTGELPALLAAGKVTPAEHADALAAKYLTAPEATP